MVAKSISATQSVWSAFYSRGLLPPGCFVEQARAPVRSSPDHCSLYRPQHSSLCRDLWSSICSCNIYLGPAPCVERQELSLQLHIFLFFYFFPFFGFVSRNVLNFIVSFPCDCKSISSIKATNRLAQNPCPCTFHNNMASRTET